MRSRQLTTGQRQRRTRLTAAAAALAAVGVLGSGCAIPIGSRSSSVDAPPPREYTPPPAPSVPTTTTRTLTGSWRGTYICAQGPTNLTLTLVQRPDSVTVTGIFRFTGAESGSYTVRGTATRTSLYLRGDNWISRPPGYEMVSLSGRLSSVTPDLIQGSVLGSGCSTFSVRRS